MGANPYGVFAARPAEVAGWEELLVRLELAPRALRHTLEEMGGAPAAELKAAVLPQLAALVARELAAAESLRVLREGGVLQSMGSSDTSVRERSVADWLTRFAKLRGRNFAAVQRRGLEVWDWAATHPEYGRVTVYQLLSQLVHEDGRLLAAIRDALHPNGQC